MRGHSSALSVDHNLLENRHMTSRNKLRDVSRDSVPRPSDPEGAGQCTRRDALGYACVAGIAGAIAWRPSRVLGFSLIAGTGSDGQPSELVQWQKLLGQEFAVVETAYENRPAGGYMVLRRVESQSSPKDSCRPQQCRTEPISLVFEFRGDQPLASASYSLLHPLFGRCTLLLSPTRVEGLGSNQAYEAVLN